VLLRHWIEEFMKQVFPKFWRPVRPFLALSFFSKGTSLSILKGAFHLSKWNLSSFFMHSLPQYITSSHLH